MIVYVTFTVAHLLIYSDFTIQFDPSGLVSCVFIGWFQTEFKHDHLDDRQQQCIHTARSRYFSYRNRTGEVLVKNLVKTDESNG